MHCQKHRTCKIACKLSLQKQRWSSLCAHILAWVCSIAILPCMALLIRHAEQPELVSCTSGDKSNKVCQHSFTGFDLSISGCQSTGCCVMQSCLQFLCCTECNVCLQALAELLVEEHNRGLNTAMTHFTHQNPDASVILFDLHNLEQAIHENASAYNITNLSEPCYAWQDSQKLLILNGAIPSVCSNPSSYAFWDALHPTRVIHQLWGEALAKQLQQLSG